MEVAEKEAYERHLAKKTLARDRKKVAVQSHTKIVARTIAKSYMEKIKQNCFQQLNDVSYFYDQRNFIIETQVVSWLLDQAEEIVKERE
jgi:hypothetical protein